MRKIENTEHAQRILAASNRHHSGYDDRLEEGRHLAALGEIDRSEVREYARGIL